MTDIEKLKVKLYGMLAEANDVSERYSREGNEKMSLYEMGKGTGYSNILHILKENDF